LRRSGVYLLVLSMIGGERDGLFYSPLVDPAIALEGATSAIGEH
jgi:hypothetical protein